MSNDGPLFLGEAQRRRIVEERALMDRIMTKAREEAKYYTKLLADPNIPNCHGGYVLNERDWTIDANRINEEAIAKLARADLELRRKSMEILNDGMRWPDRFTKDIPKGKPFRKKCGHWNDERCLHDKEAIPVPPQRVIEVRSNDATNKRNVAALARVGGFAYTESGVQS